MPRCKYCKTKFEAFSSLDKFCSIKHAIAWTKTAEGVQEIKKVKDKAAKENIKNQKAKDKATLERHKTRSSYIKDLQKSFNEFIRLRDHEQPCISCGRYDQEIPDKGRGGKWDAGHFCSVGSKPELRFVENNVHKQCKYCNSANGLGGNYSEYRKGLIVRIGLAQVEMLEGPERPDKLTVPELKDAIKDYRERVRELKKRIMEKL